MGPKERWTQVVMVALLAASAAYAQPPERFTVVAGDGIVISEASRTPEQARGVTVVQSPEPFPALANTVSMGDGIVAGLSADGAQLVVKASLLTPPGDYRFAVPAEAGGSGQDIALTVAPLPRARNAGRRPPVILLNGWQIALGDSCPVSANSTGTFGGLEAALEADGTDVYFFDNCAEGARLPIEDLGKRLGEVLNAIRDESGGTVAQFDLVAHSMGGLIARAYLAGLRTDGSLNPPALTRVRKLAQMATPNFGSYLAANYAGLINDQAKQMIPGSSFLWNLATWNQFGDDLRGVEALALIGSGSYERAGLPPAGSGDGVVTLTSASLKFASSGATHTRILPYCHITSNPTYEIFMNCRGQGIATVAETHNAIRSFLGGSSAWESVGMAPADDPWLSKFGSVYVAAQNASAVVVQDIEEASLGSTALLPGALERTVFYQDFVSGDGDLEMKSAARGTIDCGPVEPALGRYSVVRCRQEPKITSVGPLSESALGAAQIVRSAGLIVISGRGLGSPCLLCRVVADQPELGREPVVLSVPSWEDHLIRAQLPASFHGAVRLTIQTQTGADRIRVMVDNGSTQPVITSVVNGASFAAGIQSNSWITIRGSRLAEVSRIWDAATEVVSGRLPTELSGVRVTVNGKAAVVYYISPEQINALAPVDGALGKVQVVVTTIAGRSEPFDAELRRYSPAFFVFQAQQGKYATATHADGSLLGPTNLYPGASRPARSGEVIVIYATGFGATVPPVPPDIVFSGAARLADPVNVTIGGRPATVQFAGVSSNGLYQFNVVVPDLMPGDHELVATIGQDKSPSGVLLTVGP